MLHWDQYQHYLDEDPGQHLVNFHHGLNYPSPLFSQHPLLLRTLIYGLDFSSLAKGKFFVTVRTMASEMRQDWERTSGIWAQIQCKDSEMPGSIRTLSLAPFETPGHLQQFPLQSRSTLAKTHKAGEELRIPENLFFERCVAQGESPHHILHWLKVEDIKESGSQKNNSRACLFLSLLLQLRYLPSSLVSNPCGATTESGSEVGRNTGLSQTG